ncbi:universal stress protein [Methylobrevis pamukkalensis]|uniref:Universal stress protein family protein n=1 Tax=Methylobrevis pamukkalensis TaxID=1439726 RepID=A0A1E3H051_9HYPH|nr:universal stress protein [Methylobrevis pamukkalensis]ODN69689.1 Universal stress protein family protein [Methylobrevis pamukkalensis]
MRLQLLVPLLTHPDPTPDSVVAGAVAVARHLGADLVSHAVDIDIHLPPSAFGGLFLDVPKMIADAEATSRAAGDRLQAALADAAEAAGVALIREEVALRPEAVASGVARRARLADLAILGWGLSTVEGREVAEGLIFEAGRPVLFLPSVAAVGALGCVAVAWDGSRAAARALADARPFLEQADEVVVVTVADDKPGATVETGSALVRHLAAAGVAARLDVAAAGEMPIGELLQVRALALGAGLLVMGGYGHSRLREFVLGGATRGVVDDMRLPVLLSH